MCFADAKLLGGPISVSVGASVGSSYPDLSKYDFSTGSFWITLDAKISENIRAYIRGFLTRRFRENGRFVDSIDKIDFESFFTSAYIEIRDIGGQPIIFVIGKHSIPFGLDTRKMPSFYSDPTFWTIDTNAGVFGFTIKLENIPFFDLVEISGFESKGRDWSIGTVDGAALRLTKNLTRRLKASASYLRRNNTDYDYRELEDRMSIGLIFESGKWTTWVEGLHVTNNFFLPDMKAGIVAGVTKKIGKGEIIVQGTYLTNTLKQLGIGYKIPINSYLTIGAETRYTELIYGTGYWSFTARATIFFRDIFKSSADSEKETTELSFF